MSTEIKYINIIYVNLDFKQIIRNVDSGKLWSRSIYCQV